MKIRSSKKAMVASAIGMMMSGLLIVGATELIPTTKDIENEIVSESEVNVADHEADVQAVPRDLVMASVPDTTQEQQESQPQQETVAPVATNPEYADKFMVNITEYLNIRSNPDENSEVVGKLYARSE